MTIKRVSAFFFDVPFPQEHTIYNDNKDLLGSIFQLWKFLGPYLRRYLFSYFFLYILVNYHVQQKKIQGGRGGIGAGDEEIQQYYQQLLLYENIELIDTRG